MKYQGRLIVHGHVHQRLEFEADTALEAWAIANEGIDPLNGTWVEVVRAPAPPTRPDLAKLARKGQKSDAERESFTAGQGLHPKDSRSAPALHATGYMPAPVDEPKAD